VSFRMENWSLLPSPLFSLLALRWKLCACAPGLVLTSLSYWEEPVSSGPAGLVRCGPESRGDEDEDEDERRRLRTSMGTR
jgi:hypothetical protein